MNLFTLPHYYSNIPILWRCKLSHRDAEYLPKVRQQAAELRFELEVSLARSYLHSVLLLPQTH